MHFTGVVLLIPFIFHPICYHDLQTYCKCWQPIINVLNYFWVCEFGIIFSDVFVVLACQLRWCVCIFIVTLMCLYIYCYAGVSAYLLLRWCVCIFIVTLMCLYIYCYADVCIFIVTLVCLYIYCYADVSVYLLLRWCVCILIVTLCLYLLLRWCVCIFIVTLMCLYIYCYAGVSMFTVNCFFRSVVSPEDGSSSVVLYLTMEKQKAIDSAAGITHSTVQFLLDPVFSMFPVSVPR
jgi:hypothetical protein